MEHGPSRLALGAFPLRRQDPRPQGHAARPSEMPGEHSGLSLSPTASKRPSLLHLLVNFLPSPYLLLPLSWLSCLPQSPPRLPTL